MRRVRAFLAIPLPERQLRELGRLQKELAGTLPGVRWAAPETIHLTLRFFGDVAEESLEKISAAMLSVGGSTPPFQAEIRGVGAFPSPARPRVIWLGVAGGTPLAALYTAFEQALRQIGIPGEERSFAPHLTLGRLRQPIRMAPDWTARWHDVGGLLLVDRVVLFESRLQPAGALHLPLKTVQLGGRPESGPPPASNH